MTASIWWIRRDLRLADNHALDAALAASEAVIPLFVLDPVLLQSSYGSEKRLAFLLEGLRQLQQALAKRGGRLVVRRGEPVEVLAGVLEKSGANAIFAHADHSPYARTRDQAVDARLPIQWTDGPAIRPPGSILKSDGGAYQVYTPFRRRWTEHPPPHPGELSPAPERIRSPELATEDLPAKPRPADEMRFAAGEAAAQKRLDAFTGGPDAPIFRYAERRDRVDLDGTSRLSPYLRFGMLSPRAAAVAAYQAMERAPDAAGRKGAQTWLHELIWRDFYLHILHHYPQVRQQAFRDDYTDIDWRNDPAEFEAWTAGRTGYPIVDAAMRQLSQTGWMHNRARMIVASFLTKDLLIDWRWGERWFMQQLIDGDPAANNGGWQWSAGTGTDAAPYFRIFNPITQGQKHDPHGDYIRRWVPELRAVPGEFLHTPWMMPDEVQTRSKCIIGGDYPPPVVDHRAARARALERYAQAKDAR